ncbi:MAG: gliding motility-associated C-terminal domain-containing protein, partial [Saprospiraceae bacterium]|nr:gliding motility-associated C-terminal domain-containing protein [Saprospiraceae bacterium]
MRVLIKQLILICFVLTAHKSTAQCNDPVAPGTSCVNSPLICGFSFNGYCSSLGSSNAATISPAFVFPNTVDNVQFISFTASATSVSIRIDYTNCVNDNGIEATILSSNNCSLFTSKSNFASPVGGNNNSGTFTLTGNSFTVGNHYFLVIDGSNGDICDYTITVLSGVDSNDSGVLPEISAGTLTGNSTICPNGMSNYTIPAQSNVSSYVWTLPTGATITGNSNTNIANVQFANQSGQVCVKAVSACDETNPICVNVNVTPEFDYILNDTICSGNSYTFDSQQLTSSGIYDGLFQTTNGCDSIVHLHLVVNNPETTNLGLQVICSGDCFNVGGNCHQTEGIFSDTLTAVNGCDSIVNFELKVLHAEIIGQQVLNCVNSNAILSIGNSSTGGDIHYLWTASNGGVVNGSNSANSITVTDIGTYQLEISSDLTACKVNASTDITGSLYVPLATSTSSDLICNPDSVQIAINTAETNSVYQWSGPNSFSSIIASPFVHEIGLYQVTLTDLTSLCTSTATVTVNDNKIYTDLTLPSVTLTCNQPTSDIMLTSTESPITSIWTLPDGSTVPNTDVLIGVSTPGTYHVSSTTLQGCVTVDSVIVVSTINVPDISLNIQASVCGQDSILIDVSSQSNLIDGEWIFGGNVVHNGLSYYASTSGTYDLTVTDTNGCTADTSITIVIDSTVPTISLTTDTLTCSNPSVLISTNTSALNPQYIWSGPNSFSSASANPSVSDAGNYIVTVSSSNGCTTTSSIIVVEDKTLPAVNITGNTIIQCDSINTTIFATSDNNNNTFEWFYGNAMISSSAQVAVAQDGNYVANVTSATNGCVSIDSITISSLKKFNVSLPTNVELNCSEAVKFIKVVPDYNGIFTYLWSGPNSSTSSLDSIEVSAPGNYAVTVTNEDGCKSSSAVVAVSNQIFPTIAISEPGTLTCANDIIDLNATVTDATNYSILWSTLNGTIDSGVNTLQPSVSEAGNYTIEVTNLNNNCSSQESVTVISNINPPTDIIMSAIATKCYGDDNGSILIDTVAGGTSPFTYSIGNSGFTSLKNYDYLEAGEYVISVKDALGCEYEETITVIAANNVILSLGDDVTLELGDSYTLNILTNLTQSVIDTIIWNDGYLCQNCMERDVTPLYDTKYDVQLIDTNGCKANDEIIVRVNKNKNIFIPNAFSPDGDGNNDIFAVFGDNSVVKITNFQIFNRWGEMIYATQSLQPNDTSLGWNGRNANGDPLPAAVYVYRIEVELIDGEFKVITG